MHKYQRFLCVSQDKLSLVYNVPYFTGQHDANWHKINLEISLLGTSTYMLTFEGIVGKGWESDIAIDDVQFTKDKCEFLLLCFISQAVS